jgi:(2R)-sulfolactate sulfo-lyase subunit alpha
MVLAPGANMVVLSPLDNVGVALRDIASGAAARDRHDRAVPTSEAIPLGHKLALRAIAAEETVIRSGMPIGTATRAIARGALVHVHNIASRVLTNDEDHHE